jgi:hypothetical protein
LAARQWVADSVRASFSWRDVAKPDGLNPVQMAVAAGLAEMLAERASQPPSWTAGVPATPEPVFLVRHAITMPRLRRLCEEEGPEPLRRRHLLAPPDFLTAA